MNKSSKFMSLVAIAALSIGVVSAQSIKVSTGGAKGTYSAQFKELSGMCSTQLQLQEVASSGSVQNIDRIVGNEVNMGFVQTDVLHYKGRTEDLSNIKTLFAMAPEQVHLVALAQSNEKSGGTLGFGAKDVVYNTVNDLGGRTVVAAGGSYITAQVIRLQTEIPFQVVEVGSAEEALKVLASGKASAALLVGGSPLGQVASLGKEFKLLSFPEATIAKLKNVYNPAKLNYSKMGAAGVATVSTDALLVTRSYTTQKYVEGLAKLRACLSANVSELAETTGYHPSWSKVDINNKGKWTWYELPTSKK